MIFPHSRTSRVRTDWKTDSDCAFHHPLGGERLTSDTIQRSAAAAEGQLHAAQQRVGILDGDSWEGRWWKTWRLWPETSARKHPLLAYLEADTRIPHHTMWHHNGLVSALSGCGERCAFLLFQIGPVQDFIQQARTTRDLWAGSFLLSYLIARGMFALAKKVGPECIVYPQLRGVPLIDWFGREEGFWPDELRASYRDRHGLRTELLTPSLPNRFLAVVPGDGKIHDGVDLAGLVSAEIRVAWNEIAGEVHAAIAARMDESCPEWDRYWHEQVDRFPVIDYAIHPWGPTKEVLAQAEQGTPPLHGGWERHPLRNAITWATEKIDQTDLDPRCYKHRSWQEGDNWNSQLLGPDDKPLPPGQKPGIDNPGFAWPLHYAHAEWRFAAAKNARVTNQWTALKNLGDEQRHVEKDHLDGRNEVLGGHRHEDFWTAMRGTTWGEEEAEKGTLLFKGQQEYGALTAIKRLFPYVWMKKEKALDTRAPKFDSVHDIAEAIDAETELPYGPKYYAILAMDGDGMGEWVSGTRTPRWSKILSGEENDPSTPLGYFAGHWGQGWDELHAPLTPSFHAALSEALGNFSLYCAGQVVEAFGGQIIYSGGDDVLAMFPAAGAVDCAVALQIVFRGLDPAAPEAHASRRVQKELAKLFEFPAAGFIQCKKGTGKGEHTRPSWPLMVMGPMATASVGLAIGHVRSPMQDTIQAAREAEEAAKKVEEGNKKKGALCLRVLKRSGEAVEIAARFDSGVWAVWDELGEYRGRQSGRFIYRFLQKIKPLLAEVRGGTLGWEESLSCDGIELAPVIEAELADSLARQSELELKRPAARKLARGWMERLAPLDPKGHMHFWMARAFLNRLDQRGALSGD